MRLGLPIAQVAGATGFTDQSHLGRVFKAMLGITPGELTKNSRTKKEQAERRYNRFPY
jgi:transcriptional regulator GlxA family with amidase domain